jgi:hypothetical protein
MFTPAIYVQKDAFSINRGIMPTRDSMAETPLTHRAGCRRLTGSRSDFYCVLMLCHSALRRQSQRRQSGGGLLRVLGVGALVWGLPR